MIPQLFHIYHIFLFSFGALIFGAVLFLFVLPKLFSWLSMIIQKSKKLDIYQKARLEDFLGSISSELPAEKQQTTKVLSVFFFLLVALQHYLLFISNGVGARIILVGMFIMLAAHYLQEG